MAKFANQGRGSRPQRGGRRGGQLARGAVSRRAGRRPARDEGEVEAEEERQEAVRQLLRGLSLAEQAAELTRLREAAAAERRQLLWKEERISILEEAMMMRLRQGRSSELAGDHVSESAPAQLLPTSVEGKVGGKESEASAEDSTVV
ncbi:hypothetical protein MaudCBS49596_007234 [Microsporum audouinii]